MDLSGECKLLWREIVPNFKIYFYHILYPDKFLKNILFW